MVSRGERRTRTQPSVMRTASGSAGDCNVRSAETAEGEEESRRWLARTRPPASAARRRSRGRDDDDAIAAAGGGPRIGTYGMPYQNFNIQFSIQYNLKKFITQQKKFSKQLLPLSLNMCRSRTMFPSQTRFPSDTC